MGGTLFVRGWVPGVVFDRDGNAAHFGVEFVGVWPVTLSVRGRVS